MKNFTVNQIPIEVVRKEIKNLHLAVYPPDGHVRVAVPLHVTDDNIRLAVISKLRWIKKQQAHFRAQARQSMREMVTGESHYLWGKRYRLEVVERWGAHEIGIKNNTWLRLYIRPNTSRANRERVINEWYRTELKKSIPPLIEKWEEIMGLQVSEWKVKKMKTKWGSCNANAGRIWLNLELAKKPVECLEYIIVHEMVHLLERRHNEQFRAYLEQYMPNWKLYRDELNHYPLEELVVKEKAIKLA